MQFSSTLKRVSLQSAIALSLAGLSFGTSGLDALAQTKPTISVPSFKNESTWWWWRGGTSRELADALSNELSATGNFTVVERQELGEVLSEQELAELGIVRKDTGAQKGNVTGAQYVILGKVTSYEEGVTKKSSGLSASGIKLGGIRLGGGGRKKQEQAYVAIDLRVVDTTTSEVVYSRTVEGLATSKAKGGSAGARVLGVNIGGDQSEEKKVPVGRALRAALVEATDYLSCVMYEKDSCVNEYQAKDTRRRDKTKSVLELD